MKPDSEKLLKLAEELAHGRIDPQEYMDAVMPEDVEPHLDAGAIGRGAGAKEASRARQRIDDL